ncbi:MAG: T9SS type A sorting domain-containing protein [Candidatus Eisenbacteria bacterium]
MAGGGDVNGDGYSDVLVGAPYDDSAGTDAGKVSLYLGSAGGLRTSPDWTHVEGPASGRFGYACSMKGDVTGDGLADIVVGQPWYGSISGGRVNCFLGGRANLPASELAGVLEQPRQFRRDGVTPLALDAKSDLYGGFILSAVGRNAGGRTRVRTLYQVASAGSPFGPNMEMGSEIDTGIPVSGTGSAQVVQQMVSGLDANRTYHWRVRFTSDSPYFPGTRWYSMPWNGAGGTHVRTGDDATDVAEDLPGSTSIRFSRIEPNPLRVETTLDFVLPASGPTSLTIHDVSGRRMATLVEGDLDAGSHFASWEGRDDRGRVVPAGVYFARLEQGEERVVQKVVVAH